jgi:phosphohistidine phosphatase SixA
MINRREFLWSCGMVGVAAASGHVDLMAQTLRKGPAEVLLIRHAEEPEKGPDLSPRGQERAKALVKLFNGRFPKPTAIYATASSKASSRPVETVQPLAEILRLKVNERYAEVKYKTMADAILADHSATGQHVLVCWHHGTLPELAEALGVEKAPKWPETRYDGLWVIRYNTGKAVLTEEGEKLLDGDS